MSGLSKHQIMKVVNRYIGVSGGYLGDFSYRTHAEFYPEYCELDIDPYELEGTTRERFIHILSNADPRTQAKILRGVIERFPVGEQGAPSSRNEELRSEIERLSVRLMDAPSIAAPDLAVDAEVVLQALADAEILIADNGATSAVDRVHTAMHGYLEALCKEAELEMPDDASVTKLLKILRKAHPALEPAGPRSDEVETILRAFASVLDALNTLRNQASAAHPRERLPQPEAMVSIHAARTILHYIEARRRLVGEGYG